jgi:hypothetical protein
MSAPSGFGALGPGAITIVAEVADDRICSVRIASTRPVRLTRLFVDRPAREVPLLAERLYSLCGVSHATAASLAITAARGEPAARERDAGCTIALLCERLSEALRSSATSAVERGDARALEETGLKPLRDLLSVTREFSLLATSPSSPRAAAQAVERIRALAEELGLSSSAEPPRPGSWFDGLWQAARSASAFAASVPDSLTEEDDPAILEGLREGGESFAAEPSLAGRAPETGAFARHWRKVDFSGGALQARLQARMIDLTECLERLSRAAEGDVSGSEGRTAAPAPREGFAAIATSRGDLYHWVRLTADDKIANYAIVAPTEWNFHPAGPLVAELLGARILPGEARRSIARLASLFDPCVAFRVEVLEAARA